jgi:hypothetical protein
MESSKLISGSLFISLFVRRDLIGYQLYSYLSADSGDPKREAHEQSRELARANARKMGLEILQALSREPKKLQSCKFYNS